LRLLEVQDRDTRLAQLAHRAKTLPDAALLAELDKRYARVRDQVVAAETILSDLERDQAKADVDVELVRERATHDKQLLDSGSVGDPKALQSLMHEVESLARRQGDLEDVELAIMERVEGARAAVRVLTEERDALVDERATLSAGVHEQLAAIDAERSVINGERSSLSEAIPADLLALYERIRSDHGGVGAAPLHRGRCEGCRMQLPPNEIEAMRAAPPDEVIRCEECRRILVRTAESGL